MAEVQFTDPYQSTTGYGRQGQKKTTSKMQGALTKALVASHLAKTERMAQVILFLATAFIIGVSAWLLLQYGNTSGAPNLPEVSEDASSRVQDPSNLSPNFYE